MKQMCPQLKKASILTLSSNDLQSKSLERSKINISVIVKKESWPCKLISDLQGEFVN